MFVHAGGLLLQRLHRTPSQSTTVPFSMPVGNLSPEITSLSQLQEVAEGLRSLVFVLESKSKIVPLSDHEPPHSSHIIFPINDSSQASSMGSIDELLLSPSHVNANVQEHAAE